MHRSSAILLSALFAASSLYAASVSPDTKDPQYQAKGDLHRAYAFPGTAESIPYRLYVPSKWTRGTKLPLLVELHAGDSLDNPFGRGNGVLIRLAEERGMIVVAPLGYKPDANRLVYNSPFKVIQAPPAPGAAPAAPPAAPKAAPPVYTAEDRARAEQDVLNVIDLVAQEYGIDATRVYAHGNNFAGSGVLYLAQKYPERFAAVAVSSAPIVTDQYPFDRLKAGLMVIHGDLDTTNSLEASLAMAKLAKQRGVDAEMVELKEGTHLESWAMAFPQMLDFFAKHTLKK